jgi:hypothetical protein
MSRIIVFEVPDKCMISGRNFLIHLQSLEPTIELRMVMSFKNWVDSMGYDKPLPVESYPFLCKKPDNAEDVIKFIEISRKTPIEERAKTVSQLDKEEGGK